ncbi:MAG TPA: hypothetical protein DCX32_04815 [Candidatus Moranbacteria bacterium]|nr:MAG: hypothetical protein UW87_C0035G0006 [Candidatus Moranbacteria bacterium GW2011_GWC2_45_10]KKT93709.1 MAG: hypothetical protein UW95_C0021G0009 [Parcubacteria group bacterium GW2011_GWC1_45_14]HAV11828.1 hypothetical protein [Candidatus Moranbacteria bacterium]
MKIDEQTINAVDFASLIKAICNAKGDTIIHFGKKEIYGTTCEPDKYAVVMGPEKMGEGEGPLFIIGIITQLVEEGKGFISKSSFKANPIRWSLKGCDGDFRSSC